MLCVVTEEEMALSFMLNEKSILHTKMLDAEFVHLYTMSAAVINLSCPNSDDLLKYVILLYFNLLYKSMCKQYYSVTAWLIQ